LKKAEAKWWTQKGKTFEIMETTSATLKIVQSAAKCTDKDHSVTHGHTTLT